MQVLLGRLAVDDVDHDLAWVESIDAGVPGLQFLLRGVVDTLSGMFAAQEAGLQREVAVKLHEPALYLRHVQPLVDGHIDAAHHLIGAGIQLEDTVVAAAQCLYYVRSAQLGGVAQYANLSLRLIAVAQSQRIIDDTGKIGMQGRFSVAGESDDVQPGAFGSQSLEFLLQGLVYLTASR